MRAILTRLVGLLRGRNARGERLHWKDVAFLLWLLTIFTCGYIFIALADNVRDGDTQRFDERFLRALRRPDAPETPIGPAWLRDTALDATSLGDPLVVVLVVSAVAGFLRLGKEYRLMVLTIGATVGGALLTFALKEIVGRERPSVVPHLDEVRTSSFPSGHSMVSAVVYLTLGIMLASRVEGRREKAYCLAWAMFVPFLVGVSRVYLGVHYPTDVLAGWIAGLVWALLCWGVAQSLRRASGIHEPRP